MPQLPTTGQTNWGTTLNSFLEVAHDNTVANGGKVKPNGIIGGSVGQVLSTDANGTPTWGNATSSPAISIDGILTQIMELGENEVLTFQPQDTSKSTLVGFDLEGVRDTTLINPIPRSFVSVMLGLTPSPNILNVNYDNRIWTMQVQDDFTFGSALNVVSLPITVSPLQTFTISYFAPGNDSQGNPTTSSGFRLKVKIKWI